MLLLLIKLPLTSINCWYLLSGSGKDIGSAFFKVRNSSMALLILLFLEFNPYFSEKLKYKA